MPKAEVGSLKHISNQMKAKGLTRLRWYCQICERAMRDENAFKQHTLSESHVRKMLAVGSDPRKVINEYSDQFLKDFLQLLRTGHGEKQVQMNHFYQEFIAKRDHIHMSATKWTSLTDFAKYLGKEGICRVEENEKGIFISWIDTSPEALRRQEALRRKEAQDRGDEEWERRMLKAQIERAERAARERGKDGNGDDAGNSEADDDEAREVSEKRELLQRPEGDKIKLSFGSAKPKPDPSPSGVPRAAAGLPDNESQSSKGEPKKDAAPTIEGTSADAAAKVPPRGADTSVADKPSGPLKFGGFVSKPQPKNVFTAAKKKNALAGGGSANKKIEVPKKISEAERIMKEELERKRARESSGGGRHFEGAHNKRPRF